MTGKVPRTKRATWLHRKTFSPGTSVLTTTLDGASPEALFKMAISS